MFPPVHLGVGYLAYATLLRIRESGTPGDAATLAVVAGAALPDLIDQPLYAVLDLPSTRTLGHSLLVAVPVCLVVLFAVRRSSLPDAVGEGFAVGYLSHPLADALWPLLLGMDDELGFLLWPIRPSPDYEGEKLLVVVGDVPVTTLWLELPVLAAAVALWWRHGTPGADPVRQRLGR